MITSRFLLLFLTIGTPSLLFSNTLYFPHVPVGGGYSTTIVVWNTGSTPVSTMVNFQDQSGARRPAFSHAISVAVNGSSRITLSSAGALTVLWGEINAGSGVLKAEATFDLRSENGSLLNTATVAAVEAANEFVLPVEVSPGGSTALAIANVKQGRAVGVNLRLLAENGSVAAISGAPRLSAIPSRGQLAEFVTTLFPQLSGQTFKGSLIIEAVADAEPNALAAAALDVENGQSHGVPAVTSTAPGATGGALYFPHIPYGGGYSSTITILNNGPSGAAARLTFYDQEANARAGLSKVLSVPARGSARYPLPNVGPVTVVWAELTADVATITATAAIDLRNGSGTVLSTGSLQAVGSTHSINHPVEATPAGSTGVAIANVSDFEVGVAAMLQNESGVPVALYRFNGLPLASKRQVAGYLSTMFPAIGGRSFKGTLRVFREIGPPNSLAVSVLRMKERGAPADPPGAPTPLTALPRELAPVEQRAIDASNSFSAALWTRLNEAERGKNVFVSPLSAALTLGMILNGAATRTYDEMRAVLKFGNATEQEINEGYRSLIALLGSLDPAVKMQIGNSIWYKQGFPFLESFTRISREYFDAEVRGLNFSDEKASLGAINSWVSARTNQKIPQILDRIDPLNVMFLINAIYFNGAWRDKFDPARTREGSFHRDDGTLQDVQLMHRLGRMPYVSTPGYQAVDLSYSNSAFTMTVLLPTRGTDIGSFAASLTLETWQTLAEQLRSAHASGGSEVRLALPKLKLEYERVLNDDLRALGIEAAFTPAGADFTRMSPLGRDLYISFVKQKTYVDIHEEGTEAAAATIGGISVVSAPPPPVEMQVDRPFVFAIRERLSGTLLFMGKIVTIP